MNTSKLNIVHISTSCNGGAGRAAYRIHKSLLKNDINSSFLHIDSTSDENEKAYQANLSLNNSSKRDSKFFAIILDKLRWRLKKYFGINFKYEDEKIIELYNNTPHGSLKGLTPNEVCDDYDYMRGMYLASQDHNRVEFEKVDIEVGDTVRTMLGKEGFEKEKQRFSTQLYRVVDRVGYRFRLEEENGKDVKRLYRPRELLKVEEVARRVGSKLEKAEERQKKRSRQARALRELA